MSGEWRSRGKRRRRPAALQIWKTHKNMESDRPLSPHNNRKHNMSGKKYTFHLLPNAHLDPVWLWDWREGFEEGIVTCRTALDMMDEFPFLTFIRGESAIYRHVEEFAPDIFRRIRRMVKAGRWDVVGGTVVQPDTNMPRTETFCRQFDSGMNYFESKFGSRPDTAWTADSFGHSAGLPEIYAGAGIKNLAFTRPGSGIAEIAGSSAFWWEGPGGSRILAYYPSGAGYCCERNSMRYMLDFRLAAAQKQKLRNVGVFMGLGDHGGGTSRRLIRDAEEWAKDHPDVRVVYSGLSGFFRALRREISGLPPGAVPVFGGELNFCLRGCYSSVAKFKFLFRRAEAAALLAEQTCAVLNAAGVTGKRDFSREWDSICFNSFHDILPGSSIERAYKDQGDWLGGVAHECRVARHSALNGLIARVDTSRQIPAQGEDRPLSAPFLVWNPHPWAYKGPVEFEFSMDYRPLWDYRDRPMEVPLELRGSDGQPVAFQVVGTEHSSMPHLPWRRRILFVVDLPPMGWSVMETGWVDKPATAKVSAPAEAESRSGIGNGIFTVQAERGGGGVCIKRKGWVLRGAEFIRLATMEDPWGSWGGMSEEPESVDLRQERHRWKVKRVQVLEKGPVRAVLAVRLAGGHSEMDLEFSLYAGRDAVDVSARLLWNERSARLKMLMPGAGRAIFDVPGAQIERTVCGEVPGGRWVRVPMNGFDYGFASDSLYNFSLTEKGFQATVCRASRYANDVKTGPGEDAWNPAVDRGELKFKFLLTGDCSALRGMAAELERPPTVCHAPAGPGGLPRSGSFASIRGENLELIALKPANDGNGYVIRIQERGGRDADVCMQWLGKDLELGRIKAWRIVSWRLKMDGRIWKAAPCDIAEKKT